MTDGLRPGPVPGRALKLPTPAEMGALERRCQDAHGIDSHALMEQAGRRTAEVARRMLRPGGGRRCLVVVGKGNNGGDGLVAARHLAEDGVARVLLVSPAQEFRADLAAHLTALRVRDVRIEEAPALSAAGLADVLRDADLIVDAIFGTGFHGPARGLAAQVIEAANVSAVPILAVDLPSGTDAEVGRADPPCIHASATVAMALPKVGTVQFPAAAHAGRVFVADIGVPESVICEAPIPTALATAAWVSGSIPPRPADSHKGRFGRVAIVGGARGYAGAPVLAARGAIRAGAGLVTVGLPASIATVPPAALPEAMTRSLPENAAGTLAGGDDRSVIELAASADVVAIGPGLTTHPDTVELVRHLLPRLTGPVVLDADGLNAFAGDAASLRATGARLVITPHPGEMARLLGRDVGEVQGDRVAVARAAARLIGGVALLKGARTVVADPEGRAMVIPTGNPAMATGGMGDVLTGAIAALIAAGLRPFEAAVSGAYLHGLAGDLAAATRGEFGLLASEVADDIPRALARTRSGEVDDGFVPVT